jgi:hypothetical protein
MHPFTKEWLNGGAYWQVSRKKMGKFIIIKKPDPLNTPMCDMLPVPEDNLSSMIYLSSNGLSGPKRTLNCKQ